MSTHTQVTCKLVVKALVLHSKGSRVQFPVAAAVTLFYFLTCVMPMDMFCSRYIHTYVPHKLIYLPLYVCSSDIRALHSLINQVSRVQTSTETIFFNLKIHNNLSTYSY